MLKASALYMVIIIALVIGILCSALILAAYFYKSRYQAKARYDQLENNLGSGINIVLASDDTAFAAGKTFSLFGGDADSVSIKKTNWGLFDVGIVKAFTQHDTLYKTFSIANLIDSSKWAAIYLIDEDRPFSLSGKTTIRGDAYIPKAGVQQAYVDNKAYQGDKRLIIGHQYHSQKTLTSLDQTRLALLETQSRQTDGLPALPAADSIERSFLKSTLVYHFRKAAQLIQKCRISGNIILLSDTSITIDSTASLDHILVFARSITVKSGFKGSCQLFATDSIHIGARCYFGYPSVAGVMRFKPLIPNTAEKLVINRDVVFSGTLFTYQKQETTLKPYISVGKHTQIGGQVYSQGSVELKDSTRITGSLFTGKFVYRTSYTLYENYLINTTIDSKALSPYYLGSNLLPAAKKRKKVLQWLEAN
jgi:cytoskeletal protein CcmA (bactofilin family)